MANISDVRHVRAGIVPAGMVLVYKTLVPVYEYDPHPLGDPSGYISYHSDRHTAVYEAGRLAPIEAFNTGILLESGETAEYEDDEYGEYYTILNRWGRVVREDDTESLKEN